MLTSESRSDGVEVTQNAGSDGESGSTDVGTIVTDFLVRIFWKYIELQFYCKSVRTRFDVITEGNQLDEMMQNSMINSSTVKM
jgi:hypothetical protein